MSILFALRTYVLENVSNEETNIDDKLLFNESIPSIKNVSHHFAATNYLIIPYLYSAVLRLC